MEVWRDFVFNILDEYDILLEELVGIDIGDRGSLFI